MRSFACSAIVSQEGLGGLAAALGGLEGLGGDPRGDLAGLGAAHPVGDGEQRRAGVQRVLVGCPLPPGVRPVGMLDDEEH